MTPRALRLAAIFAMLVLMAGLSGCSPAHGDPSSDDSPSPPRDTSEPTTASEKPIKRAADFKLTLYEGDETTGAGELRLSTILTHGRPVVLNFWAGACPPCRREMPDLQDVYELNQDRVLLLGVDGGPFLGLGTVSEAEELIREMKITYPTGTTGDARIIQDYGVVGMPTTYFIKPNGEVVGRSLGLMTREKLDELIEDLIERSAAP